MSWNIESHKKCEESHKMLRVRSAEDHCWVPINISMIFVCLSEEWNFVGVYLSPII